MRLTFRTKVARRWENQATNVSGHMTAGHLSPMSFTAARHCFTRDPRPMLTCVQLHGLGAEQITVRVDRLDKALMDDGSLGEGSMCSHGREVRPNQPG